MNEGGGLAERVLEGDVRSASRLMRLIDDRDPKAEGELRRIFPHTGKALIVGVTGVPGAGKSTITDRLIAHYRKTGARVGVLAVDPTSPFSGGAILGDRIRMQGHASDRGVFIRSLATRGNLGGLSLATADCLKVMEAMGQQVIIVETVGVGQDEIDVARLAHTTVVVLVPGMGDDIQAIKAGILEVADVFVVNKADLDGADRVVRELRGMLELRHAVRAPPVHEAHSHHHDALRRTDAPTAAGVAEGQGNGGRSGSTGDGSAGEWEPPILKVVALDGRGIDELGAAIAGHGDHLDASGERERREEARALVHFLTLLRERLLREGLARLEQERGNLELVASRIAHRLADPYALAEEIARREPKTR
jgi:LAO/AO transport system kinase